MEFYLNGEKKPVLLLKLSTQQIYLFNYFYMFFIIIYFYLLKNKIFVNCLDCVNVSLSNIFILEIFTKIFRNLYTTLI